MEVEMQWRQVGKFARILLFLLTIVACTTPASPSMPTKASPIPAAFTALPPATPIPPSPSSTPQANLELRFFYDWNPQDPFNLHGSGLNSLHDEGEPYLAGFVIKVDGESLTSDENGRVSLSVPETANPIMIEVPNTNKSPSQKDMAGLGIQFGISMYEPERVNYGPRFFIDLQNDHCQRSGGRSVCEIGITDGYLTSPYQGENYLYSSPWTFDSGLNFDQDFISALENGKIPSPAGDMYFLGALGKLIASYANTVNQGVPYGYPYLLSDQKGGINAHLLMDLRNDPGVAIYAPAGGTICKGNSSEYAICAVDVKIDINDIRAIPEWQYGLNVRRGQLIGWTDAVNNITGEHKPFPLIHMGNFELRDRATTLAHFPFLTPEQVVMGARADAQGRIVVFPRDQVLSDYGFKVQLPQAPRYFNKSSVQSNPKQSGTVSCMCR
jgi:hypothetical protein